MFGECTFCTLAMVNCKLRREQSREKHTCWRRRPRRAGADAVVLAAVEFAAVVFVVVEFWPVTEPYTGSCDAGGTSSQARQSQNSGMPAAVLAAAQPVTTSVLFGDVVVHKHSASQSSWRSTAIAQSSPTRAAPVAAAAADSEVALVALHAYGAVVEPPTRV